MDGKITEEILASYLKCAYKSHLQSLGMSGIRSDYETMLAKSCSDYKQKVVDKIIERSSNNESIQNVVLNRQLIQQGLSYLLNVKAENEDLCLTFDGLKKIEGTSKRSKCYLPMLFCATEKIHRDDRRKIALYGLVLAAIQGWHPPEGIIIYSKQFKKAKIRLNANDRKTRRILEDLANIQKSKVIPKLILNNHCQVCEFCKQCLHQATGEDNLSLLHGITEKQISTYNRRGIFSVSQLSHTYHARKKPPSITNPHHDFALQALAIRDNQVFIVEPPTLSQDIVHIYLDIEGIPERQFDYLVGALISTPDLQFQHSFWADNPSQEATNLDNFLDLISKYSSFHVFHYGTYDINFLKRMRAGSNVPEVIDKIILNSTNVLSLIYGRIYFPVYSNSLKDIARLLGYAWKDEQALGINSIAWRCAWESSDQPPEVKERLLVYNGDDCAALKVVTDFLYEISTEKPNDLDVPTATGKIQISYTQNMRPTFTRPDWSTVKFATTDLDYVNRCAYFNYQREKVYVRTNSNIAKQNAKRTNKVKKWIKATKIHVEEKCSICPYCGSHQISKCREILRRRKCIDLKISEKAVKRVVNEYSSYKYRCVECHMDFFADKYMKMLKYEHSLKSFAMYEYVAHRVSMQHIEETFRDLFSLPVCMRHILIIKRIMANYYKETVEGVKRRLEAGPILHADETQIHLQRGKGYVWVFTNLEEVMYIFTPTRDGSFQGAMFSDFKGVLISDFYAVYDWPNCLQQKCLIHLIRDLNTELLRNPFDDEYKGIVTDFGGLLRKIIATVDKFGLKSRHLAKHQREVNTFLSNVENQRFSSKTAVSAQERFIRNKDHLFTFLKYDGVPWNNNNAEHAVKCFAHYGICQ